jgi:hypothetical protein
LSKITTNLRMKEMDNPNNHPAIRAVYRATKRLPPREVWGRVIATVGEKPDIPLLYTCVAEARRCALLSDYETWLFGWYAQGYITHFE